MGVPMRGTHEIHSHRSFVHAPSWRPRPYCMTSMRGLKDFAFSTRLADWHEHAEGTKAVNILTIIEKMDKQLLKGTFHHYKYLSEICPRIHWVIILCLGN